MLSEHQIVAVRSLLDAERRAAGEWSHHSDIVREYSPDGRECTIIYSHCSGDAIDAIIREEIARAQECQYTLEWKVYGHDVPADLPDRLRTAGFQPDPVEKLLVLPVSEASLAAFAAPAYEIRRVWNEEQLDDYAAICREVGRANADAEKERLAMILRDTPEIMSVYIAYIAGEPVGSGRIYFLPNSVFGGIYGGNTKTTHRNRGIYTALVAARLRETLARNRDYLIVDALPTSEPILRKRGFEFVTDTQPFLYHPPA